MKWGITGVVAVVTSFIVVQNEALDALLLLFVGLLLVPHRHSEC
jgi:hypothetical protein